jgi:membrane-bound lytic murein transglycosylase B
MSSIIIITAPKILGKVVNHMAQAQQQPTDRVVKPVALAKLFDIAPQQIFLLIRDKRLASEKDEAGKTIVRVSSVKEMLQKRIDTAQERLNKNKEYLDKVNSELG